MKLTSITVLAMLALFGVASAQSAGSGAGASAGGSSASGRQAASSTTTRNSMNGSTTGNNGPNQGLTTPRSNATGIGRPGDDEFPQCSNRSINRRVPTTHSCVCMISADSVQHFPNGKVAAGAACALDQRPARPATYSMCWMRSAKPAPASNEAHGLTASPVISAACTLLATC
jgi:hypothetical protein